jgi:hypothetical protein
MGLGGYLPGLAKNWKICLARAKNQSDQKNTII